MAGRSESGIDWDLEMELARKGYTFEDTEFGGMFPEDPDTDQVFGLPSAVGYEDRQDNGGDLGGAVGFDRRRAFANEVRVREHRTEQTVQSLHRRLRSFDINEVPDRQFVGLSDQDRPYVSSASARGPGGSPAPFHSSSSYFTWQDALAEQQKASLTTGPAQIRSGSDTSYFSSQKSVIPPKPSQGVPRKEKEVRATAWKNQAVQPQTDYKCSDGPRSASSSSFNAPPSVTVFERKKSLAQSPMTITKDAATSEEKRKRSVTGLPPEPKGKETICVAVMLPSGKRIKRRFNKSDSLVLLKDFIRSSKEVPNDFEVGINCPRRLLQCNPTPTHQNVHTFEEAGITTNEILFVELPKSTPSTRKSQSFLDVKPSSSGQVHRTTSLPQNAAPTKKPPPRPTKVHTLPSRPASSSNRGGG